MVPLALPVVSGALSLMVQMAESQSRERYETALAELRAGVLHDLIEATYHKRFDAIRAGFESIMQQFHDQAAHYMRQQDRYADEELNCTDPIRRIELRSRMREADKELQTIRIDSQMIYAQMLHAMHRIGVPSLDFAKSFMTTLALPSPTEVR